MLFGIDVASGEQTCEAHVLGAEVGEVTSGGFSPVLQENIAMGYVQKAHAKAGTELLVETRGKSTPAVTTKMPFVTCHYHRPAA